MNWPITLLRNRDDFWHAVQDHRLGWRDLLSLALFVILACGLYGAVLAGWRSPRLSLYVAFKWPVAIMDVAKMPLIAICSLLLCFPSLGATFKKSNR